jgi:hypothetical protein
VKRALALCGLAIALLAGGCGSGAGSGAADPAKLAPAGTLAYASFEIAPQGPEKQGFDAAFGKLLGPDPQAQIAKGFVDAIKEHGSKLDYAQDVKPWLGDSVAAVLTGVAQNSADFAVLVASTDDDKARAAIDKDLQGATVITRSYRGVDYRVVDGHVANAVVDHFLVAGTEPALKAVVDAKQDGRSLADTQQWHDSVGDRAAGKIGLGYVDFKALMQSAISQLPGAERIVAPLMLGLVQIHPFVATLDANADSLVVDVSSPGTPADKRGPVAASSPLIEALPADSWVALALPQVGQALQKITAALKANPIIGGQYARVSAQVKRRTGLDVERDVLAGLGDVGAFVRGSSARTVGGGVVLQARDGAALRRSLGRLPALITSAGRGTKVRATARGYDITSPHMPQPVQVRIGPQGAVAAYGASSTRAATAGGPRLGATDLFRKAAAAVGARPTLFVALTPAIDLLRASHRARKDSHFAQAAPRLAHLEYAAVGALRQGGLDVIRAVIGLR